MDHNAWAIGIQLSYLHIFISAGPVQSESEGHSCYHLGFFVAAQLVMGSP